MSLLRVLHVLGPEIGLDTAQLFAWKTRVVKTMEQINQQRQLSNDEEIVEEQGLTIHTHTHHVHYNIIYCTLV